MPVSAEAVDAARARLTAIVARFFEMSPEALDARAPLALYGLDSLRAIELVAALEEAFERRLPEWLLLDHPDIETLTLAMSDGAGEASVEPIPQIVEDCVLPQDIRPSKPPRIGMPRHVLLTGATGFLGAYLLRELLTQTEAEIHCLVRPSGGDPLDRIRGNLERNGLGQPSCTSRVRPILGDLARPNMGLSASDRDMIQQSVDAVYHAAADVDWTVSYRALRNINVIGTRELLRLACAGPAAFHFVSSLSVCYAVGGPRRVYEEDDMLPLIDRLPLGYAQSKCAAESLVRQAADRGLAATIHRPALVVGDAVTGAVNADDLISALVKGCIQMGEAPDLDWTFDAVPVDYAARAIVALSRTPRAGLRTFHLANPQPRHWRECVLWMNLFGYGVALQPYERWRARVAREAVSEEHALYRLRTFLLRGTSGGATIPELYQDDRRSTPDTICTRRAEAAADVACPRVDADVLDRYFGRYIASEILPPPRDSRRYRARSAEPPCHSRLDFMEAMLRRYFHDDTVRVIARQLVSTGSDHSIIGELTSWRDGRRSGLFHYRLGLDGATTPSTLDVIVKAKPVDHVVVGVGATLAATCDGALAEAFRHYGDRLGQRGGHAREPAIYDEADERLKRCMPACFGTWRSDEQEEWGVAIERLNDAVLIDTADDPHAWTRSHVEAAVDGLAAIHASWYGREAELVRKAWIGYVPSRAGALEMMPLWRALGRHAAPFLAEWGGHDLALTHERLIEKIEEWWRPIDRQTRTLVHNDFNPRNVALRQGEAGLRLCAYDWELAGVGIPQRDLAEFLCFVLPDDASRAEVDSYLERHRAQLGVITGRVPETVDWQAGFRSALAELLVNRLAVYVLINRVRRQRFLPRVLRTWRRLFELVQNGGPPC